MVSRPNLPVFQDINNWSLATASYTGDSCCVKQQLMIKYLSGNWKQNCFLILDSKTIYAKNLTEVKILHGGFDNCQIGNMFPGCRRLHIEKIPKELLFETVANLCKPDHKYQVLGNYRQDFISELEEKYYVKCSSTQDFSTIRFLTYLSDNDTKIIAFLKKTRNHSSRQTTGEFFTSTERPSSSSVRDELWESD